MSLIKHMAAAAAVSGLLLSSAAHASATRADAIVAKTAVQPMTLASSAKLKRHPLAPAANASDAIQALPLLLLVATAATVTVVVATSSNSSTGS